MDERDELVHSAFARDGRNLGAERAGLLSERGGEQASGLAARMTLVRLRRRRGEAGDGKRGDER